MSWHLQASEYRWRSPAGGSLEFSVFGSDFLAGVREWRRAGTAAGPGRRLPIHHLFALDGRLASGPLVLNAGQWSHHVRGADLIAESPYSDQTPTGIECYWRPEARAVQGMMLEWWVSANTRLLDEQVQWSVSSEFELEWLELGKTDAAGHVTEWCPLPDGQTQAGSSSSTWEEPLAGQLAVLARLSEGAGYLALAAAVGDQRSLQIDLRRGENGRARARIQHELEMGFLEKGVIRRARLCLLWLADSESIRDEVRTLLREFYLSPQPLTV
jgi:hypothetical protein